ncbi:aminoglycoside phosphotransferase (APT) family kinase protein [Kibdelosporangium banguiense]|uniref:Aminoglycoside phosphotransferase (APT) family kinase protein n=1 Tax=Kibdelosporangium banguiense TaxID=1365924 RepID=A0ABS4TLE5_9PSEU|nr:aminoglycoside phosphotransferase family protein [Kibdelosporangium banguiense]MBP2325225.1 aminoglycoside phosphotransferase (APT) family kinase protein [Kibdelosporangium banguiense]
MNTHKYRRRLDREDLGRVLTESGVDCGGVREWSELTEASYNTAYRIKLTDGTGLVLKVAPDPEAPALTYEHGLMRTEAEFYRAALGKAPVPEVVHISGNEFLLMTELPGANWFGQRSAITEPAGLRTELGRHVAALHEITGPGFGYPQNRLLPGWRAAFTAMMADILADAERYEAPLPIAEIRGLVHANEHLLDAVRTPVLVHFDLWDGNILVHDGRISGLVDGERAMWADPVAEFVSLALFGDIEQDQAFFDGYGPFEFTGDIRRRLAMYRCYLFLIMIVEGMPRGYQGARHEQVMAHTRQLLDRQLDRLR